MENKLEELKIKRDKKNDIGKRIGNQLWFHKDYATAVISDKDYLEFKNQLPEDYDFNIIRYNQNENEIAFINSPDFNYSNEPLVGNSLRVKKEDEEFVISKIQEAPKNPLIYHHKWLFVKDDYKGFNVDESKQRSIDWKTKLGVDRVLTSKIGRLSFWNNWLNENNLNERVNNPIKNYLQEKTNKSVINKDIWGLYLSQDNGQEISSASTARIQIPRTVKFFQNSNLKTNNKKLLDIGCGIGNEKLKEEMEKMGIEYNGCDPFNKQKEFNLESIKRCMNGQSDFVTFNNVLNTIKEKEVWKGILAQAKNALKEDTGILSVLIYEGEKTKKEKEFEKENNTKIKMEPMKTRDGWQNRMKIEEYLSVVSEIFPNSKIVSNAGIKMILASNNPELNLENEAKKKNKMKIKR